MRAFIACLLLVLLSACGFGPDTDVLRSDVGARLAQALPDGAVEIASLTRRGSQSDTKAPDGVTQRIIYFDAELTLTQDLNFGAWNAPGIAGLISALGAAPKGIEGITSGGNKAGDIIRVHGTALYRHDGQAWSAVMPAGYKPPVAPEYVSAPTGDGTMLAGLRKVVESVPRDISPAQRAAIEDELAVAQASIRARLARVSNGYAIAAGAEHGQYLRLARAISSERNSRAVPLITRGGEENLQLLRSGKVSLALAQGDAALDAYEGTGAFSGQGPYGDLRAIASLYPEPMHVLVRAAGAPKSIKGLRGKRVAIGEIGSASRTTALRVLQAHGLGLDDIIAQEPSIGTALLWLLQGKTDAVFQVIGTPASSIRDSLQDMSLRLLPLSGDAIAKLSDGKTGYFPHKISQGTYFNQNEDVQTIATAALLLTNETLSDVEVETITRRVFQKGSDYSARGSAQGAQISVATSRTGVFVPMHPAAVLELDNLAASKSQPQSQPRPGP